MGQSSAETTSARQSEISFEEAITDSVVLGGIFANKFPGLARAAAGNWFLPKPIDQHDARNANSYSVVIKKGEHPMGFYLRIEDPGGALAGLCMEEAENDINGVKAQVL